MAGFFQVLGIPRLEKERESVGVDEDGIGAMGHQTKSKDRGAINKSKIM